MYLIFEVCVSVTDVIELLEIKAGQIESLKKNKTVG